MENKLETTYQEIKEKYETTILSFINDLYKLQVSSESKAIIKAYCDYEEASLDAKENERKKVQNKQEETELKQLLPIVKLMKKIDGLRKKGKKKGLKNLKVQILRKKAELNLDANFKEIRALFLDKRKRYTTNSKIIKTNNKKIKERKKIADSNKKVTPQLFETIKEDADKILELVLVPNYFNNLLPFLMLIDQELNLPFKLYHALQYRRNQEKGIHSNIKIFDIDNPFFTTTHLAYYNGLKSKTMLVNTQGIQYFKVNTTSYFPVNMKSILCFKVDELISSPEKKTRANGFLLEMFSVYLYILTDIDNFKAKVLAFKYEKADLESIELQQKFYNKVNRVVNKLNKKGQEINYINEISYFIYYFLLEKDDGINLLVFRNNKKGQELQGVLEFLVVLHSIQYILNNARNFIKEEYEYNKFKKNLDAETFANAIGDLRKQDFKNETQALDYTKKMLNLIFPTFIDEYLDIFERKKANFHTTRIIE